MTSQDKVSCGHAYERIASLAMARAHRTGRTAYAVLGRRVMIADLPPMRVSWGLAAFTDGTVELASYSDNGSVEYR